MNDPATTFSARLCDLYWVLCEKIAGLLSRAEGGLFVRA